MTSPKPLPLFCFILLASLFFFSCSGGGHKQGDKGKKMREVRKLQKEVMKVHDQVMPKMGELQELKKKAARMADSLEERGDSALAATMDTTEVHLERGHESMMNWMRNYKQPADSIKAADAIDYLEGQKEKVKAMRETMMGALEQARGRLDSLERE